MADNRSARTRDARSLRELLLANWPKATAVVLSFLILGVLVGALLPVRYAAQAKLIAGAANVNVAAVPAFAEAGKSLAETYSRVFLGDSVRNSLQPVAKADIQVTADGRLSWRTDQDGAVDVMASPIAGSSLILIEAHAAREETAILAANSSADALSNVISGILADRDGRERAQSDLDAAFVALGEAQANSDPSAAGAAEVQTRQVAVDAYRAQLNQIISNSAQANGVQRLSSGMVTSDSRMQRIQFLAIIGLVVGGGVAIAQTYMQRPKDGRDLQRPASSPSAEVNGDTYGGGSERTTSLRPSPTTRSRGSDPGGLR